MTTPADGVGPFAVLLQQYRQAAGLSQEELAERAGLSARGISDLERGVRRSPYPVTVRALAKALGLDATAQARLLTAVRPRTGAPEAPRSTASLPIPLSSFVGREREVAEIGRLLATTRLLTLTGTGGIGKTRLALQVAAEAAASWQDGVRLVELAPLANPALVPHAVATAVGAREQPGRLLQQTLADALRDRRLLLVLDNCEHLVHACAELIEALLRTCPHLRILTTSREPLSVAGEVTWAVQPLEPTDAELLFIERARAAESCLHLTEGVRAAVVTVCRRLDGIPLAIELAAARARALSVHQIAARLDDRFRLLTNGPRSALPRQQTLQATLDWSYRLLSATEQALFQAVSVFAGGWTLEAAEAVCSVGAVRGHEVLGLLAQLVDKSLVGAELQSDGAMRYRLLETVRAYATDRLAAEGDPEPLRHRHAEFFVELAEHAEPEVWGAQQRAWLDRLEQEHDNFRVSLRTCLGMELTELAGRLSAALWRFWATRGHLSEGRGWLEQVLTRCEHVPEASRARALNAAAWLALLQADYADARRRAEACLAMRRTIGDLAGVAESLMHLAETARQCGELDRAQRLIEESLVLQRRTGSRIGTADALNIAGMILYARSDAATAADRFAESLARRHELGDIRGIASTLANLGDLALGGGDLAAAASSYQESLDLRRDLGDTRGVALVLGLLGDVRSLQGQTRQAEALYREGLELATRLGAGRQIAACRDGLARLIQRQPAAPEPPRGLNGSSAQAITAACSDAADQPARWSDHGVDQGAGLQDGEGSPGGAPGSRRDRRRREPGLPNVLAPEQLTRREREVAALVAQGLTNRQIADTLSVSERTVHSHMRSILGKLAFTSRAQIAAWVARGAR